MGDTAITVDGKAALVDLPVNYNPATAYPCLVFLPGLGETGTAGTSKLLVHGPFLYLSATVGSGQPIITIAVEPDEAYGLQTGEAAAILASIASQYNVSKFYLTGLSLGCQEWMNFVWTPGQNFEQIGGVFMFSADPPNVAPYGTAVVNYSIFKTNNLFYYGACGSEDSMYGMQYPVYQGILAAGATAFWDDFAGAGHGDPVWSDGYNPAWSSPSMGMSIYAKVAQLSPITQPVTPPIVAPPAGLSLPSATTAQLVTLTPSGPMIYWNTTTKAITVWNGTSWQ
jgi:hypothetical protein